MSDALRTFAILIPLLLAVAAGLLLAPDGGGKATALQCVTGEAAQNPTQVSPSGQVITMPAHEYFETVEEAQRWICLDVKQAELLPGWRITGVVARRSLSLDRFEGGNRALMITYRNHRLGTQVHIESPCDCHIDAPGTEHEIEVQDLTGTLWIQADPPSFFLLWGEGEQALFAFGGLIGVDFEHDILPFLRTIR